MKRLIGLCVVVLMLAACDGGNSSTSASRDEASSSSDRPEFKSLSKAELRDAVLPVNALPTGYGDDPDADETETDKTYCDYKQPHKASTYAERSFIKGGGFSAEVIVIVLRQFDDADQARSSFAALRKTMKTCKKDKIEGDPVTFSVLSTPDLEDGSIGIATNADEFSAPQFFTLAGPTLISVGGGGLVSTDTDALVSLLKKQIARYKEAAEG